MCGTTPKPLKSCGLRTQKDVVWSPEIIGKRLLHEPSDVHSVYMHNVQCTI